MNKKVVLATRPVTLPATSNFKFVSDSGSPIIKAGEVLVKVLYLSMDPFLRGRMRESGFVLSPLKVGQVVTGAGVGQVLESLSDKFVMGDFVYSNEMGWEKLSVQLPSSLKKLTWYEEDNEEEVSILNALDILGIPGATGETILVSSAAGAVGLIVGQLALSMGCTVVGIAGSKEKCDYLLSVGFHATINYKSLKSLAEDLLPSILATCPKGVDVFFDNVGGTQLDVALQAMNKNGRIVSCGLISQYNSANLQPIYNLHNLLIKRLTIQGFVISDVEESWPEYFDKLVDLVRGEKLKMKRDVQEGIEQAPNAFLKLFSGNCYGKVVVKVDEEW